MTLAEIVCGFCGEVFADGEVPGVTLNGEPVCQECMDEARNDEVEHAVNHYDRRNEGL